jgi:hypothetical protein
VVLSLLLGVTVGTLMAPFAAVPIPSLALCCSSCHLHLHCPSSCPLTVSCPRTPPSTLRAVAHSGGSGYWVILGLVHTWVPCGCHRCHHHFAVSLLAGPSPALAPPIHPASSCSQRWCWVLGHPVAGAIAPCVIISLVVSSTHCPPLSLLFHLRSTP